MNWCPAGVSKSGGVSKIDGVNKKRSMKPIVGELGFWADWPTGVVPTGVGLGLPLRALHIGQGFERYRNSGYRGERDAAKANGLRGRYRLTWRIFWRYY